MSDAKHLTYLKIEKLATGEDVVAYLSAQRDDGAFFGIGYITNLRVGFCRKGLVGERFDAIPLEKVSSIEVSSTLGFRKIKIHTSHDSLTLRTSQSRSEVTAFVAAIETRKGGSQNPAVNIPTSASEMADPVAQLERLGQLHASGILTQEEFDRKKVDLLSRI